MHRCSGCGNAAHDLDANDLCRWCRNPEPINPGHGGPVPDRAKDD